MKKYHSGVNKCQKSGNSEGEGKAGEIRQQKKVCTSEDSLHFCTQNSTCFACVTPHEAFITKTIIYVGSCLLKNPLLAVYCQWLRYTSMCPLNRTSEFCFLFRVCDFAACYHAEIRETLFLIISTYSQQMFWQIDYPWWVWQERDCDFFSSFFETPSHLCTRA